MQQEAAQQDPGLLQATQPSAAGEHVVTRAAYAAEDAVVDGRQNPQRSAAPAVDETQQGCCILIVPFGAVGLKAQQLADPFQAPRLDVGSRHPEACQVLLGQ